MHFPVPYIFAILSTLLIVVTLWRLWAVKATSRVQWIGFILGNVLSFLFIYLACPWAYLSYYLRLAFLITYIVFFALAIKRAIRLPWQGRQHMSFWIGRVIIIALSGSLVLQYFMGSIAEDGVNVEFPFKSGQYYVMQGGGSTLTNFFHRNYDRFAHIQTNAYATDIARLNRWGNRASGLYPDNLEDYAIFGDTIYSPVAGIILVAVNNVESNKPGYLNTKAVPGNHVVIQANGFRLMLLHMQQNKVFVKTGDTVRQGQPIGLVGNSGFSSEPHLHINALVHYSKTDFYNGLSVPIRYNGHFYKMNNIISR